MYEFQTCKPFLISSTFFEKKWTFDSGNPQFTSSDHKTSSDSMNFHKYKRKIHKFRLQKHL